MVYNTSYSYIMHVLQLIAIDGGCVAWVAGWFTYWSTNLRNAVI